MGNSLQDQLKRSGLVDDKQLKKARQEQRRARKRGQPQPGAADAARADVRQRAAEKAERDRRLNAERDAAQAGRARR